MSDSRQYRGLAGMIRLALNTDKLKGELNEDTVRGFINGERFNKMPRGVITKSLAYMHKNFEIQRIHGRYYSKDVKSITAPAPAPRKESNVKVTDVCVIGKLVGTSLSNGRMIANIEVTTLDYK